MASPLVLPNSLTKEEHREAGKRRLEEFRKKRAANQAKRASSSNSVSAENRSERTSGGSTIPAFVAHTHEKTLDLVKNGEFVVDDHVPTTATAFANGDDIPNAAASQLTEMNRGNRLRQSSGQIIEVSGRTSSQSSYSGKDEEQPKENDTSLPRVDSVISPPSSSHENYDGTSTENKLVRTKSSGQSTSFQDFVHEEAQHAPNVARSNGSLYSDETSRSFRNVFKHAHDFPNASRATSDLWSSNLPIKKSLSQEAQSPLFAENNARSSRPSFLDSLKLPPSSSTTQMFPETAISNPPKSNNTIPYQNAAVSSDLQNAFPETRQSSSWLGMPQFPHELKHSTSLSVSKATDSLGQDTYIYESDRGRYPGSSKHNDDFAALEQHIEDLTQEKFSLQRALEAARTLAESLAAENSTLTDTYNQQGIVINELKFEIEKLHREIKDNLVKLESLKAGYSDAHLECNAADERAKLLASELIELEEKALKLRSNELKLQRQLEDSHTEIDSVKKKIASLQNERQDLHSTIDALQEEKRILQSKLSKASERGKVVDTSMILKNKKDASISTEGLGAADDSSVQDLPGLETLSVDKVTMLVSMNVPSDQKRIIDNINVLISELAMEKEELARALAAQSSQNSKLKVQTKELTRKLEIQTQRLELLTSQSMAASAGRAQQPESRPVHDDIRYPDEGDEVVERVLSWIMKLFPGGPSRRRSGKLH